MTRRREHEQECRELLGDEKGELVALEVGRLAPGVSRPIVWLIVLEGLMGKRGFEALDPDWIARRDQALSEIDAGIRRLERLLEERGRTSDAEDELSLVKWAFEEMLAPIPLEKLTFASNARKNLLTKDQVSMGWKSPTGRPVADWKHSTIRQLVEIANCSRAQAEAIAEAAGLSGKTPSPAK